MMSLEIKLERTNIFLRQFRAVADATHDTHLLGAGFDLRAAAAADANGASTASVSLMWNGI